MCRVVPQKQKHVKIICRFPQLIKHSFEKFAYIKFHEITKSKVLLLPCTKGHENSNIPIP